MSELKRQFLGVAEVDSGTLLIADPAYVLPRASDGKPGVDCQEVIDADATQFAAPIGGMPVVLLQRFGGDAPCLVYGDFDDGELVGIYINLDPPMDDDDEEGDDE